MVQEIKLGRFTKCSAVVRRNVRCGKIAVKDCEVVSCSSAKESI
jgi:hypothetical protein